MSFNAAPPVGVIHSSTTSDNSTNNALPGVGVTVSATAPRLAPDTASSRSCVTCRRRKVRCNKRSPCSNCVKAGIDCVFPPPGRAPRKSKRPADAALLSRLRRLEGVIEHLSGNNPEAGSSTSVSPTQPVTASFDFASTASAPAPAPAPAAASASVSAPVSAPAPALPSTESKDQNGGCPFGNDDPTKLKPGKFENEFGRLVIDEGRSRYVSNRLWASLGDEVNSSNLS